MPAHATPSTRALRRTPSASYRAVENRTRIDLPAHVSRPVRGVRERRAAGGGNGLRDRSARASSSRGRCERGAARVLALGPDAARDRRDVPQERRDRRRLHAQRAPEGRRRSLPPRRRETCRVRAVSSFHDQAHRCAALLAGRGFVLLPAAAYRRAPASLRARLRLRVRARRSRRRGTATSTRSRPGSGCCSRSGSVRSSCARVAPRPGAPTGAAPLVRRALAARSGAAPARDLRRAGVARGRLRGRASGGLRGRRSVTAAGGRSRSRRWPASRSQRCCGSPRRRRGDVAAQRSPRPGRERRPSFVPFRSLLCSALAARPPSRGPGAAGSVRHGIAAAQLVPVHERRAHARAVPAPHRHTRGARGARAAGAGRCARARRHDRARLPAARWTRPCARFRACTFACSTGTATSRCGPTPASGWSSSALLREPLLRIDAGGVWVNASSPTATADGLVSSSKRGWVHVNGGRTVVWHDHRLAPPPARAAGPGRSLRRARSR